MPPAVKRVVKNLYCDSFLFLDHFGYAHIVDMDKVNAIG